MGKGRVVRLVFGEGQIQINKCSHQVGFTRTHRKAEQVIGIRYSIKSGLEKIFIIDTLRIFAYLFFQLLRNLLTCIVLLAGVLK